MRLISTKALMKRINCYPGIIRDIVAKELRYVPTVDAEPVRHGRWIREPNCWYRCSECGSHYPSIANNIDYHYCPNCGAKMDEEKENE